MASGHYSVFLSVLFSPKHIDMSFISSPLLFYCPFLRFLMYFTLGLLLHATQLIDRARHIRSYRLAFAASCLFGQAHSTYSQNYYPKLSCCTDTCVGRYEEIHVCANRWRIALNNPRPQSRPSHSYIGIYGGPLEIPRSLSLPFSISNTHPWTQSGLLAAAAHPEMIGLALHRFSTCAFTFSSTRMGKAAATDVASGRLRTEEASDVSGVNHRLSGVSGDGVDEGA